MMANFNFSKISELIEKFFVTDKEDKKLHGIGLKSIRESFEKYGGDINIQILDNKFIFKGFIPIK